LVKKSNILLFSEKSSKETFNFCCSVQLSARIKMGLGVKRYLVVGLVMCALAAQAQTVVKLKNQSPDGAGIGFLLTDGRVLYQGNGETDWWTLTPDNKGQYVTGTWAQVGSLPSGYSPLYFASAVLADGRLVITGGEYNFNNFVLTDLGAVFDPTTNAWTNLNPPSGWGYTGDSPSSMLPSGKFLVGRKLDEKLAVLNPKTLTWTAVSPKGKKDFNAEEGWTLMPDGTVMTCDVKSAPNAERYSLALHSWSTLGNTPVDLAGPPEAGPIKYPGGIYTPPGEIGPAILLPNGTVFATGSTPKGAQEGHTAIYTPGAGGAPGTWAKGPDFPRGDDAGDSYAALLPSGNVLVEGESGTLYEFNGTALTATKYNGAGNSLLVLPTGEVLIGGQEVYRALGTPLPAWAPAITAYPAKIKTGTTYKLSGTQFNGLSQAESFGDEDETATNYPLVRITNTATGDVVYARTHDHSTMGVATGTKTVFTFFDAPATLETGASTLQVVTNGIASAAVSVTVAN